MEHNHLPSFLPSTRVRLPGRKEIEVYGSALMDGCSRGETDGHLRFGVGMLGKNSRGGSSVESRLL
jgi:hypothetical protein